MTNYLQDILNDPTIAAMLAGPPQQQQPTPMMMAGMSEYQGDGPESPPEQQGPPQMGGMYAQPPTLGPPSAMPPGYGPMGSPQRNPMGPNPFPMPGPFEGPAQPTFRSRLKDAIPAMVRAGLAGASTPNVVGGGAVDIFRAMQAGGDANQRYELMQHNRSREGMLDAQNREKQQADIEHTKGATRYYDAEIGWRNAEAAKAGKLTPAEDAYANWKTLPAGEEKDAAWERYLLASGHAPKPEKDTDLWYPLATGLGTYNRKTGDVKASADPLAAARLATVRKLMGIPETTTDADFLKSLPAAERQTILFGKPENGPRQPYVHTEGPDGTVTFARVGDDGKPETVNAGKIGKPTPPKEPSAAQLNAEHKNLVRNQAGMIYAGTVKWLKENGGKPEDVEGVALSNAQTYFKDNPDVSENVGEIMSEIQHLARTQSLIDGKKKDDTYSTEVENKLRGTGGTQPKTNTAVPQAARRGGAGTTATTPLLGAPPPGMSPQIVQMIQPGKIKVLELNGVRTRWTKDSAGRVFQIDAAGNLMH